MAYSRVNWVDTPSTATPVDAANLNVMDIGINNAYVQGAGTLVNADLASGAAVAISKLADPGSGKVITSAGSGAIAALPPGYEFPGTYVEMTAPVSVGATTEAGATTVVTAGAITFDGSTVVMIESFLPSANRGTTYIKLCLYDGSSSIGLFVDTVSSASGNAPSETINLRRRLTPSNAAHTYSIRAFVDAGTGSIQAGAGGVGNEMPGWIRIVKVA